LFIDKKREENQSLTSCEKSTPHNFRVFLNFFIARSGLIDRLGDFNIKANKYRNSSVNDIACCSY